MGGPPTAFDKMLATFAQQHERFLADCTTSAIEALKDENRRLHDEVNRLKEAASECITTGSQVVAVRPPPPPTSIVPAASPANAHRSGSDDDVGGDLPGMVSAGGRKSLSIAPTAEFCDLQRQEVPTSPLSSWSYGKVKRVAPATPIAAGRQTANRFSKNMSEDQLVTKEKRRLRALFKLSNSESAVPLDRLHAALKKRMPSAISHDETLKVLREMKKIQKTLSQAMTWAQVKVPSDSILFDALVEMVVTPGLGSKGSVEMAPLLTEVANSLNTPTIDEVIDGVTVTSSSENSAEDTSRKAAWEARLNAVVATVVLLNILSMGISIDHYSGHCGWLVLEAVCCAIFILEVLIKTLCWGPRKYFLANGCMWNWMDVGITIISIGEVAVGVYTLVTPDSLSSEDKITSGARITVMLRVLRVARMVRLMKLANSSLMKDLANMMVGFLIGIPSLFWVLFLFGGVVYMIALIFRFCVGPDPGQDMIAKCGPPDDMIIYDDDECKVHYMYGEEYFRTVPLSMFTTFRFMLGDYSTRAGKSIVVAFSQGFGMRFDILFVCWMIIVIFGIFNIITAIFVDTTISGLKHNDVKRKYARQYEHRYVRDKLKRFINRVEILHKIYRKGESGEFESVTDTVLDQEEFLQIMEDNQIRELLMDLDVDMYNPSVFFDTFDADASGAVSMNELVVAVMKLRGEPQKNDIIASWVSLRALHSKFDHLQYMCTLQYDYHSGQAPENAKLLFPETPHSPNAAQLWT